MGDSSVVDADMAVAPKLEDELDGGGTPSSIDSVPEPEAGAEASLEPAQPQKRKGGRKPIYATSEERKQRNRQAQAAFRERRSEFIKQLEATIKQNEDTLATLQQSHRSAADECLMLRYKNSLLERILLEKGIDVQSELQMKNGSPILAPGYSPGQSVPLVPNVQPPLQRTALHQARRSTGQAYLSKSHANLDMSHISVASHAHPTPSSHASSPTQSLTRSPMHMHQGGIVPSASAVLAQPQPQHMQSFARVSQPVSHPGFHQTTPSSTNPQRPSHRAQFSGSRSAGGQPSFASSGSANTGNASVGVATGTFPFYPSPFQKHFDQLDQEYDAQHAQSMLDDPEHDDPTHDPSQSQVQGSYTASFDQKVSEEYYQHASGVMHAGQPPMTPQTSYEQGQLLPSGSNPAVPDAHFEVDPNDPMMDADPFGLSASMHYPTSYSFDPHNSHNQR